MKRNKSMRSHIILTFILYYFTILVFFGVSVFLVLLYINTKEILHFILMIAIPVVILTGIIFFTIYLVKTLYRVYFKGIYETTKENLDSLYDNKTDFKSYPSDGKILEIEELNNKIKKIQVGLTNSTIVSSRLDYSKLEIKPIEGFNNVFSLKSLKDQLDNLIHMSNSFRNALLEIYYDLGDFSLTNNELTNIFTLLDNCFKDYENRLFFLNENAKSVYVYLPQIDTFSRIGEQLVMLLQNISVAKEDNEGIKTINARAVLVCYPYSDIDELFHDLNYAKQKDKIINFYFPNRVNSTNEATLKKDSVNLNVVSKILESLGKLKVSETNEQNYKNIINDAIRSFAAYLDTDDAGILHLDPDSLEYSSSYNVSKSNKSLFKEGSIIAKDFVETLNEGKDIDNSYYFSTRSHANNFLGRYFDRFRINSGFYYVIENDGVIDGVIYFFNRNKQFIINSYLREGLVLFASKISEFLSSQKRYSERLRAFDIIDSILTLSNKGTYRIDKSSYEIVSYSKNLLAYFPSLKVGSYCHKALFDLEKPCPNCPILTSKKMFAKYKEYKLETSLSLSKNNTSRYANLFIDLNGASQVAEDRFNRDFLVNSYKDLAVNMENCYIAKSKGHLLLLKIDNYSELISNYGSEITLVGIRTFLSDIKKRFGNYENIYYFNSQSFAILFQDKGQIDIVNRCEEIFEIAKKPYFNDENTQHIKITYLPMVYPSSYPSSIDFLRNAQRFFDSNEYESNKDMIYFEENGYTRSASKEEFMLSVVDDKFGNQTFTALLQPYLRASDKTMYGVEMLLRLHDDYRNINFNPDEVIKVAARHGKMQIISDALITYAGNLYNTQGSAIFKTFGFKRFSINIDYSYFSDEQSSAHLVYLLKHYNFPKDFIAFEIPEWDIKAHANEYREIIKNLHKQNVIVACDQYSEQHISIEKLHDIGFDEIKISRSVAGFIDSDPQKATLLKSMIETAKNLSMQVSVVGLENNAQYEIVKEADGTAFVQGFYFFKPLDKNDLINALRSTNVKVQ